MFSLDSFHAAYDAETAEIVIGGRSYPIFVPRSIEPFRQNAVARGDSSLWARVWPASIVLAELVASMPVDPQREMIEIGGGLGHVSIVAAACGHRITCSEANPHALAFAKATAVLNGLPRLPVVHLDWGQPAVARAFDTVIGSELVYRDADIAPLERLFTLLLKPGGEVILVGEVRRTSDAFMRRMAQSFRVRVHKMNLRSGAQAETILVFRMSSS
ncbi:MAG: class I SAM-dependent methyltransferase [Hyphomicrobiales bacterium]